MKQHIILVKGTAKVKTGLFMSKTVEGFIVVKATNYTAEPFYTAEDLDKLLDIGVTYEIKYK